MVPPLRAATADARMMTGDTQDRDKKKLSKPRTAPNAAMPEPSWAFPPLNEGAGKSAAKRQATLTKPAKSLGTLEEIPVQLARLQGTDLPRARPAATILFAADHSVCQHGVSAYPSTVTAAMVRNFAVGGAAASVAASHLDIPLQVVDVGVAHPYGDTEGSGAVVVRHPVA
ncbi:MAG: nicotinate-nucleotide--dimethylbenzimidazole phosphoribosyltransferase, partial [Myxococcota bacterium]